MKKTVFIIPAILAAIRKSGFDSLVSGSLY
jgi:hypothetical protein